MFRPEFFSAVLFMTVKGSNVILSKELSTNAISMVEESSFQIILGQRK